MIWLLFGFFAKIEGEKSFWEYWLVTRPSYRDLKYFLTPSPTYT